MATDVRTASRDASFGRAVRSEWIKLRTLRLTWITLGVAVAVMIALGGIGAAVLASGASNGPGQGQSSPLSTVLSGSLFAVIILGALGAVHGAREFGSAMITATLTATPRRPRVVLAKAAVIAAVVLPAGLVASFAAWAVGTAVLSAGGAATAPLSDGAVFGSVVGTACWLTAAALIGLGLGVLLRSVAGSIAAVAVGILIVPPLASNLLPSTWSSVTDYLPSRAANTFTTINPDSSLPTVGGVAVVLCWVALTVAAAALNLRSRDI